MRVQLLKTEPDLAVSAIRPLDWLSFQPVSGLSLPSLVVSSGTCVFLKEFKGVHQRQDLVF